MHAYVINFTVVYIYLFILFFVCSKKENNKKEILSFQEWRQATKKLYCKISKKNYANLLFSISLLLTDIILICRNMTFLATLTGKYKEKQGCYSFLTFGNFFLCCPLQSKSCRCYYLDYHNE